MKTLAGFALALLPLTTSASDFFLIEEHLPEGVKSLHTQLQVPNNPHPYSTPLGVTSRCFRGAYFLVLSENTLGKGYELTHIEPNGAHCVNFNFGINQKINDAEMYLGMDKQLALRILRAPVATNETTLLYNKQKLVDGNSYDEQTWVDVEFSEERLKRLSVFTSITN